MAKILIKRMSNIPDWGTYLARFVGADIVTKTPAGDPCNYLVVTVELIEAKDRAGNPFNVSKTYNLSGRGVSSFSNDYKKWSGQELSGEQLESFDPDALLLNKEVKVAIILRKEGLITIPVIDSFKPAIDTEADEESDQEADQDKDKNESVDADKDAS
jgi:hypothetical protein